MEKIRRKEVADGHREIEDTEELKVKVRKYERKLKTVTSFVGGSLVSVHIYRIE